MTITFAGTLLAGPGPSGPRLIGLPGAQVTEEVPLFRAVAQSFFGRGNISLPMTFAVLWTFNTRALAEQFMLTHFAGLATSGDLVIVCGDGEPVQYTYKQSGAVLEGTPDMTQIGQSVLVRYQFRGGVFAQQ